MRTEMDFEQARGLLLDRVLPVGRESVPLEQAAGRVLAEPLCAAENVPAFDRSPYDGYALRAADVRAAGREAPVTLRILEEIAAGGVSHVPVTEGTCVKILTGAPIPPGADCVEMYENTVFDAEKVTFFAPRKAGENIIRAGEDVRAGMHLAEAGETIDPGLAGTLAAQGCARPLVYARPRVALLSTGSELVEVGEEPGPGMIRNSNRYTLTAALGALGCEAVYYGIAGDRTEDIAARLERDGKVTFVTWDSWLRDHVYANGEDLGCCHGDVDPEGYFTVDPMVMGIGEVELPETCRDLPEITVTLNYCVQRIVYVVEGDTVRCAELPIQNYPVDIIVKNVNTD